VFKKLAVATDGSPTAELAVGVAFDLAARYDASLLVLSAYEPVSSARVEREAQDAPDDMQWKVSPGGYVSAMLAEVEERARARGLQALGVSAQGEPAAVICDLAEQHDVDLLVIGNKGMNRRVFGSVPKSISQHAPCSVVIAKTT